MHVENQIRPRIDHRSTWFHMTTKSNTHLRKKGDAPRPKRTKESACNTIALCGGRGDRRQPCILNSNHAGADYCVLGSRIIRTGWLAALADRYMLGSSFYKYGCIVMLSRNHFFFTRVYHDCIFFWTNVGLTVNTYDWQLRLTGTSWGAASTNMDASWIFVYDVIGKSLLFLFCFFVFFKFWYYFTQQRVLTW